MSHVGAAPAVSYVIRTFPKLSESFVLRELLALHEAGEPVEIWSLVPPSAEEAALVPAAEPLRSLVRTPPPGKAGLVRMTWELVGLLARHPARTMRVIAWALWWTIRDREPRTFAGLLYAAHLARHAGARHLHAHFVNTPATVAVMAAWLSGRSASYTAHARDLWVATSPAFLRAKTARCTFAAGETQYAADMIARICGTATAVHCVTNIVPAPDAAALGRAREPGLVVSTARLVEKKGLDVLLRAVAELAPRYPQLRVELVGDGPQRAELEALAASLGIGDVVVFRGAVAYDDVRALLRRASIFALPAREAADGDTDGLPVALLEALAHELAVVSTPIAGIPEAIVDGVTGRLVPADDAPALAVALAELLDDPAVRAALGRAGAAYVARRHSGPRNAAQLRALWR